MSQCIPPGPPLAQADRQGVIVRWSYPYGTPDTAAPILGTQGDPYRVFDFLAGAGYAGVELFVRDPAASQPARIEAALRHSGLTVAAVGTGPAAAEDGLALASPDGPVRDATVERLAACVDLAHRFGAGINIGKIRGTLGTRADGAWQQMRDGLRKVADRAQDAGLVITIEPQNSRVLDNILTTADGVRFVADFDHPSVRLMIDSYHADLGDRWPSLAYVYARHVLRHVHFADTRRQPPGRGKIDLRLHLATLMALGYDGFITLEIDQLGDPLSTAREAAGYVRELAGLATEHGAGVPG